MPPGWSGESKYATLQVVTHGWSAVNSASSPAWGSVAVAGSIVVRIAEVGSPAMALAVVSVPGPSAPR